MTFGISPFGASTFGSKIGSLRQTIEQLNSFINTTIFYDASILVFHRSYTKAIVAIDSGEVDLNIDSPTVEITII